MSPLPPFQGAESRQLVRRIGQLWLNYVKGQLLEALCIGVITWIVGEAIGLAYAGWLGCIAGLLETIPSLGPLVALVPAVGVALWKGSAIIPLPHWAFALIVIAAYLAIQQLGSLVLQPHLLGKRLHLPPLVVLLAVILGAALGNVLGAYLAVPLLVTLREVMVFLWRKGHGLPPFPEEEPTSACEGTQSGLS